MFGYLNTTKTLEDGQRGLWQTFMCGLCFSTKKLFGNLPRMFISNDINLFNVLFHSILQQDVQVVQSRCAAHPVRKRSVLATTPLTDKLAVANVLLVYLNLYDDVVDGGGLKKKTALKAFSRHYKKAQKQWQQLDQAFCARYRQLRRQEKANCNSPDAVAHSFAMLSQDFCRMVLGDDCSQHALTLCYNLGKWIYLVDALDDAQKDCKKGNYNVFLQCYEAQDASVLAQHKEDISFLMYAVLNRIAQSYNDLNLTKYTCVLKDVLLQSIRDKTAQVLKQLN